MVNLKKIRSFVLLFFLLFIFIACHVSGQKIIVVKPIETDSFLLNPGRGFTSTGNTFNENLGNRLHTFCGVSQQRYYWDQLEPEEGKINFSIIDSAIAKAAKNKQQLNFRVMCQDEEMRIPQWAIASGATSPFYDNPVFIEKQINLIEALGAHYDGNPDVCFVDIGSIGQWGEWHTDPDAKNPAEIVFPTDENAKKIIDAYFKSFTKTPLAALISYKQKYGFQYAVSKGSGWRADCWGDMDSLGWNHMKGVYPQALQNANAYDSWKNGPVALETCWTMSEWYKRGWNIDYILNKALEWHATEVNNGTEAIPEEWYPKVKEFEKKLGYRFVLKRLTYPSNVKRGASFNCRTSWENKGVAPVYNPYNLAVHLVSKKDSTKSITISTDASVKKWLPGNTDVNTAIAIPNKIEPGEYDMEIGIVALPANKPVIQLAIQGKTEEGWYKIGKIQISN